MSQLPKNGSPNKLELLGVPSASTESNFQLFLDLTPQQLNQFYGQVREYKSAIDHLNIMGTGRADLKEMQRLHHQIPADHRWEITPNDEEKNDPQRMALIRHLNAARAQQDPQKLLIFVGYGDSSKKQNYSINTHSDSDRKAGYNDSLHAIIIFLPEANKPIRQRDASGKIVMARIEPEVLLGHEIDHALTNLRHKWGEDSQKLTKPCKEERAVDRERDYVHELNSRLPDEKKLPMRDAYIDPDYELKKTLAKEGGRSYSLKVDPITGLGLLDPKTIGKIKYLGGLIDVEPEQIEKFTKKSAPHIFLQAGCKGISEDELLKRTRALLHENGLQNNNVSDAQMKAWIDAGLKRQELGKYKPER